MSDLSKVTPNSAVLENTEKDETRENVIIPKMKKFELKDIIAKSPLNSPHNVLSPTQGGNTVETPRPSRELTGIMRPSIDIFSRTKSNIQNMSLFSQFPEQKKETVRFAVSGKASINSMVVLMLLIVMRISTSLATQNISENFLDDLKEFGWTIDDMNTLVGLTFSGSTSFCYLIFCALGIAYVVYKENSMSRKGKSKSAIGRVLFLFLSTLGVNLSYLLQIFAILYNIPSLLITSRVLLGIFNALNRFTHYYVITKEFYHENFCMAISYVLGLDSFAKVLTLYFSELLSLRNYMWLIYAGTSLSIFISITFPKIDLASNSAFQSKSKESSPDRTYFVDNDWKKVLLYGSIFILLHTSLYTAYCFFIQAIPNQYGGILWNYKNNGNSTDPTSLLYFRAQITLFRGIWCPLVGAVLDMEFPTISHTKSQKKWMEWIFSQLSMYQYHILIYFLGFSGATLSCFLFSFTQVSPNSFGIHSLAFIQGISDAFLEVLAFVLPMLFLRATIQKKTSFSYTSYILFMLFLKNAVDVAHTFIDTETILYAVNYPFFVYIIIFTAIIAIILFIFWRLSIWESQKEKIFYPVDLLKKDVGPPFPENAIKTPTKPSFNIFIFLYEIVVACTNFFFIIVSAGTLNYLVYGFFWQQNYFPFAKLFFIPIIYILWFASFIMGFPQLLKKFYHVRYFPRTRDYLGLTGHITLAERLKNHSAFTYACLVGQRSKNWYLLEAYDLQRPIVVYVVPDDIVLKSESHRFEIYEKDEGADYTQYDSISCSNGVLCVNEHAIHDRTLFNYETSLKSDTVRLKYKEGLLDFLPATTNFSQWCFIFYTIYFLLPILYRVIVRATCNPILLSCQQVLIIEDPASEILNVINFLYGFFIIVPFLSMWKEINLILERILDITLIFCKNSLILMNFNTPEECMRMTEQKIMDWDNQFNHLNQLVISKGEFVKVVWMFAYGTSKAMSVIFSMVALFAAIQVSSEIVQIVFLVLMTEIMVLRFIVQPASIVGQEVKTVVYLIGIRKKQFKNHLLTASFAPSEKERLEKVYHLLDSCHSVYNDMCLIGFGGFFFRMKAIATNWPVTSDMYRNSGIALFVTVIPSAITYFLRQIKF